MWPKIAANISAAIDAVRTLQIRAAIADLLLSYSNTEPPKRAMTSLHKGQSWGEGQSRIKRGSHLAYNGNDDAK